MPDLCDELVKSLMVPVKSLKGCTDGEKFSKELASESALFATKEALEYGASHLPTHISYALTENTTPHLADAFALKGFSLSHFAGDCYWGGVLGAGASWSVKVAFLLHACQKDPRNRKKIIGELLKITLEEAFCLCFTAAGKVAGGVVTLGNWGGMVIGGLAGNLLGRWLFKKIRKFIRKKLGKKGGYKSLTYVYAVEEGFDKMLYGKA